MQECVFRRYGIVTSALRIGKKDENFRKEYYEYEPIIGIGSNAAPFPIS
jgi:hypothetical protein